ncbi:hypothetical protein L1987_86210 [Smallanthus sonchifolius]|uniref:Uncharacterized protein n=1 Tax=Smallanthus sonchifolius TaxID=185202 RepID=A0ACB8XXZ4_9ASTR|nr:hypothetical protein L1987_86210 [Smallanthus sonchifolius]
MLQHSESIPVDDDDAVDEFAFFDASDSFDYEHSLSVSDSSSVYDGNHGSVSKLPDTPEPQSSLSSAGLRRRRLFRRSSKELGFKNSSDGSADFELHGSNPSPAKSYKFSWNLKDNHKLNDKVKHPRVRVSSGSGGKRLTEETDANSLNSLNSTGIVTLTDDGSISDRSVTVDSPVTGSNFVFTLARLIIKVISLQTTLLVAFVSFPIWLAHSAYMFVTDPFAIMRRVKRYMIISISRVLNFCLNNVKCTVYKLIKRNKSVWKLCLQIGWGLLWAVFVGFVLVGLLVFAFVIGAAIMKCIIEVPVHKIEQLNFDYTRNSPMAFVPMSCPEPSCLECNEKIEFEHLAPLRVIPPDHKLQATVLLTLPESDYNKNLGNFQVRVDFLSSNGKSLASATQPCTMRFKSWPIRLLMTVFKLAPLITGYSSESQTLHIKFDGYTEREIPTCGARVVLEPRAEFAKGGGVPEIYTAYLKLESQLPLLQRILWSWKVTVFVWTSIMIFTMGSVFIMLCCIPVFVPGLQLRRVPLNNTGSR